ncbi:MAG TPA: GNAT family N-acetyltransferase [Pyrinomonadaceae bacterium]|nr:GNAT family N-acetyltransferase [Pyrinomonadaceae bacterium]
MPVTLRPATPEDEEFLLKLYATVRAEELAQVPWSDLQKEAFLRMQFAAQQFHYREHNPTATHDIILLDGLQIGRLYVARRESEIRILDITILPEHRNRGIGTPIIKDLMDEATRTGKPLNIWVEFFNPSHKLFERLGFVKVEDDRVNHLMEWKSRNEG